MKINIYRWMLLVIISLSLVLLAACGSGTKTTTSPGTSPTTAPVTVSGNAGAAGTGHGTMSAKIDGQGWKAVAVTSATYSNGIMSVAGADSSNPVRIISFAIVANGPGTYQIGQTDQVSTNGLLVIGTASWQAVVYNGSGSITITSLTSSGASGTFVFNMNPSPNTSATGTKVITDGTFQVTFSTPAVIPTIIPSAVLPGTTPQITGTPAVTADINGEAWSGQANQANSYLNQRLFIISIDGKGSALTLGVAGVTAAGTYSLAYLNPNGSSAVFANSAGQAWSTLMPGGTGTITITTLTSNRAAGTFSFDGIAAAGGATGVLHVTSGHFDVSF